MSKRVAVIGAGWSGLAAAVELIDHGHHVEIFEASRTLGGRARSVEWNGITIDNGQHILIGAYTETLRLMRKVGVDPEQALLRMPLTLNYPGEFRMVAPKLPAPFHTALALLTAQGLDWREKFAAVRLMLSLKRDAYRIEPDITVTEWLNKHHVPPRQRRYLWDSLCISALNTPADRASAQIMANVLRDSLGGSREASDMLLPRRPLSDVFPEPAGRYITQRGGLIRRKHRVRSLVPTSSGWAVDGTEFDSVIVATAPYHARTLLEGTPCSLDNIDYEPIVTVYARYPTFTSLAEPMLGISHGTAQWLVDHGSLGMQPGLIAAVISAQGSHLSLPTEQLETQVCTEIARYLKTKAKVEETLTVTEKRATFSCRPDTPRPFRRRSDRLWLAGDYVASDYPATIEGAVRTALACATDIAANISATDN